ncbi:MAG: excinuclease ABC subunit UvrA [Rickettsiaceae bacterium H1]|nr:excinuclease ABC subunit UvrA [Rickettsiaceae bacterium H1]
MSSNYISIKGARENNLRNFDIEIPKNKLVVITGVSGSGKSSLAFDIIYAEGQRRYVESLSAYARQFLQVQDKADVDSISGLSPTIAINQKTISKNPRSTVATTTEIYDYLRLLYARIGTPYSPKTGKPISSQTIPEIQDKILQIPEGTKVYILASVVHDRKGEHTKEILQLKKQGFSRIKIDGTVYEIDNLPIIDKNKKHTILLVVDRLVISPNLGNRLTNSLENASEIGNGIIYVEIVKIEENNENYHNGQIITFSQKFSCPETGFTLTEIEPRVFSFNSPHGACKYCNGLGKEQALDLDSIIPDKSVSVIEGAIAPWGKLYGDHLSSQKARNRAAMCSSLSQHFKFNITDPWEKLTEEVKNLFLFGSKEEKITMRNYDGKKSQKAFDGVINYFNELKHENNDWTRNEIEKYSTEKDCTHCSGSRLKPESLCVKIEGKNIAQVSALKIEEAIKWVEEVKNSINDHKLKIADKVLDEIIRRLKFLLNVGLSYLELNRSSATLSGGESQRIRLASQIGSGLTGVIYVLDEPSIGLHQCDNELLLNTLKNLRNLGNSVIVIEHDEETMMSADHLIDIGPGAGSNGGKVISQGKPQEIMQDEASITGRYLSGKETIPIPQQRKISNDYIELKGVNVHNIRNLLIKIPLRSLVCVTGMSGSGKSSLVIHALYNATYNILNKGKKYHNFCQSIEGLENITNIIEIDQSPIGRTPLSNPATYTGVFNYIRDWFSMLPESKARGYKPGRFSFNNKGGRCEACQGHGVLKIEMHFLPDVYVKCEQCKGKRYNRNTLEITYKGKSIDDVLNMTVDEALIFFDSIPIIKEKMKSMKDVNLGYIKIGQYSTTLSGGEAQRVKLSKELSKRSTGNTLYILDEPTTALHTCDIKELLNILTKLVKRGNTIVVIEHNLHVIKSADYVIDMGPKGGDKGGKVIATGTPEEVAKNKNSVTGRYLQNYLQTEYA